MLNSKIKKLIDVKTFLSAIVVATCVLYYGVKYINNRTLIFEENLISLFIVFSILTIWCLVYLLYNMKKVNSLLIELQQSQIELQQNQIVIKQNNEDIKTLVNIVAKEQITNHDSMVKLHQNTRSLLLDLISDRNA